MKIWQGRRAHVSSNPKEMTDARTIDNDTFLGEICILLSQGKKVKLRAKGNSMRPFIHGNEDTLILAPTGNLHNGDVVFARIDGKRYVVHRIIGMRGDRFTLMGDGNLYETEKCSRSDIYGTVESVIRKEKVLNIGSQYAICRAKAWRTLLPVRRLKVKLSNWFKRK